MSLDVVNKNDLNVCGVVDAGQVFGRWQDFPVSQISHHGQSCCEVAREWLFAMDFAQLNAGNVLTGPRWIRQRYNWGPTRWEINWCKAVRQKMLDCGALAALAHEVFTVRGVQSFRVQLVQQFNTDATAQWTHKWNGEEASLHWINEDVIYHEGCAVITRDNEIKVWDASAGWWINPNQAGGYGSLIAIRIFADGMELRNGFKWGNHQIQPDQWQMIEKNREQQTVQLNLSKSASL